jgi:hypothetical protein
LQAEAVRGEQMDYSAAQAAVDKLMEAQVQVAQITGACLVVLHNRQVNQLLETMVEELAAAVGNLH